ncbi:unnamed protein product, partial [Aureobasidium mustum]
TGNGLRTNVERMCTLSREACEGYRKALVVKHYDASGSRTNNFSSCPKQMHRVKQTRSISCDSRCCDTVSIVTDETWLPSSSNLLSSFWSDVESVLLSAISPEWQLLPPSDRHTGKWLQEVVYRSKNSTLLSRSIRALSATYVGKVTGAIDLIMVGQSYYATALGDMRRLLSENDDDIASVQSAAMLLTFFELLNPSSNQAWIQHAGGVTRIMMLRGPSAYTQGFDKVCYMAMRNFAAVWSVPLIRTDRSSDALISGSACFLDDDSWLIANGNAQDLSEIMFRSHIKLPALLHDLQNTAVNGDFPQIVLAKALALRDDMLCSFHRWLDSKRVIGVFPPLSTGSDSLDDHTYMFPELQSLILYCSHYAVDAPWFARKIMHLNFQRC